MSKSKIQVKKTLGVYWQHVKQHPALLLGGVFSVPITTLVNQYLPPLIVANILDRLSNGDFVDGQVWASFGSQLVIYVGLLIAGVTMWRITDMFVWLMEAKVTRSLAQQVFHHLLNQSADFHANSFGGSLVSQTNKLIGSYVRIADTTIYQVLPLFWGLLFTAIILAPRAPLFVVAFFLLTVIYIVVTTFVTRPTRRQSAAHAEAESRQTGHLADGVTNVMAIKSFAGSTYENNRFARVTRETQKSLLRVMRTMQMQMMYFSGITKTFQLVALVSAVVSIVMFDANIATVFLVLSFASQLADQLFTFSNNSIRNYNRSFGDASEMTAILQITPEIKDPENPEKSQIHSGRITFEDVDFTHKGNTDALFKDLDVCIKPGEKIGLVGHSGSGKTTLTRLLMRFSDVNNGAIKIDDQDIRDITQDDLHKGIAYVPQEPIMFHRSLRDNIRYGDFKASEKEVIGVAKMAHAHEFIKDLPEGYDTLVGERGVKLSGGQRQRIAIARAMLKNAPILLLDEATSALDSESEALIQDALWKLMEGRTAIVIAHRLSTIQKMDRILVMEDGKIVEQGTHKELIRQNGTYAELWNHQTGGFIEE